MQGEWRHEENVRLYFLLKERQSREGLSFFSEAGTRGIPLFWAMDGPFFVLSAAFQAANSNNAGRYLAFCRAYPIDEL